MNEENLDWHSSCWSQVLGNACFRLEAGYPHATLHLVDRTDFHYGSRSVRDVWTEGRSLGHTSRRRTVREAGILYAHRPRGCISVGRLRPNTPNPSPLWARRIGCCGEPL